jgi:ADP-heptose:LPS heptosyltransferase
MATPAIRALRRGRPEAVIDLLTSPWAAPALEGNPDLDAVLTIEATWFEPGRREGPEPRALLASLARVLCGGYDAAADLRGDFRSILIARLSGAPIRAGYSRVGLERLLTDTLPLDPALDYIGRNHAVVSLLGAAPLGERRPVFLVPDEARTAARRMLACLPGGVPVLAIFPGTNRPGASWGAERFAAAGVELAQRRDIAIVLGGREADRPAVHAVAAALAGARAPVLDLAGRTSFAQAAALIESSSALLANDSGASHLAVAVGTPVVSIFGPTDPKTLWTWDHPERYAALSGPAACRRPCFDAACRDDHGYGSVTPGEAAARLERMIASGASVEAGVP